MMILSCYYPNSGAVGATAADSARVSTAGTFLTEVAIQDFRFGFLARIRRLGQEP